MPDFNADRETLKRLMKTAIPGESIIEEYLNFRQSVQERADNLFSRFKVFIACTRGCSGCCYHDLNLRAIEFVSITMEIDRLPSEQKTKILRDMDRPVTNVAHEIGPERFAILKADDNAFDTICPLLSEGACILYPHRPIICRVWGLPLIFSKDDYNGSASLPNGVLTRRICGLNFRHSLHYSAIPEALCINQHQNTMILDALNERFVKLGQIGRNKFQMRYFLRLFLS